MEQYFWRHFVCTTALTLLVGVHAVQAAPASDPVTYEANSASYNQLTQVATFAGNVRLQQGPQILIADTVVYDRLNDKATAAGNVQLLDKTGNLHKADQMELSAGMKQGIANRLTSILKNGGRVKAATGQRLSAQRYQLDGAEYTGCSPCERDPTGEKPAWKLSASNVTVDDTAKNVTYKNAVMRFYGVPVLYTPWFRHSIDKTNQKSGFLTPKVGWNSNLGGFYEQSYYFGLAPDYDATLGVLTSTSQAPIIKGQLRKRYAKGELKIDNSFTRSSRTDNAGQNTVSVKDELRGHLFSDFRYDINNLWRAGASVQLASDPQYLRQYRIDSTDVLENKVYAERFSGRHYASANVKMFQDVRTGDAKVDQPGVLPHLAFSALGDAGKTLGGRWGFDADLLSLFREGSGQDVYRFSTTGHWQRRDILPLGFVVTSTAALRTDAYRTQDRDAASITPGLDDSKTEFRTIPTAHIRAAYPLEKRFQQSSLRLEPEVAFTAAPKLRSNASIPNEDSTDAQIDTGNLFDANRFPGYDRIEDKSHVAYGVRAGYYDDNGDQVRVFIGQSKNLSSTIDNPFPTGSGLETSKSDYVGEVTAVADNGKHVLSYKTQLDGDSGRSERHEVYVTTKIAPITFDGTYVYTRRVPSSTTDVTREQVNVSAAYQISEEWALRGGVNYNLDATDRGLREVMTGVDYTHECYNFALTAEREVAKAASEADQLTIMLRFGLKTLGEFTAGGG